MTAPLSAGPAARLVAGLAVLLLAAGPAAATAQPAAPDTSARQDAPVPPDTGGAGGTTGECAPAEAVRAGAEPWAQLRLAPSRAWPLTRGAVTVAVVGTGVSAAAPALAGAVLPGTDLAGGRGDTDCAGHGTFLAGLIAARPAAGTPFAGVAPAARVLPVRVADDPARADPDRVAAGIRAAVDGGARVVAVGVVTGVSTPDLRAAVADAVRRDVVVVAAAGVREAGRLAFPAALPGVVAVAPIGPDGPTGGPLGAAPLLAAPAEQVTGPGPTGPGHRTASGPELAVAFTAGAAALVRDYRPGLSAAETVARLRDTADRPAAGVPDPRVGFGVLDPVAAVTAVAGPARPVRPATAAPLAVPSPPAPDPAPVLRALWFAAALLAAGAVAAGAAAARRRGGDAPTSGVGGPRRDRRDIPAGWGDKPTDTDPGKREASAIRETAR
ncbi:S8 family serine peptidase [Actinokineospora sp. 24-640]